MLSLDPACRNTDYNRSTLAALVAIGQCWGATRRDPVGSVSSDRGKKLINDTTDSARQMNHTRLAILLLLEAFFEAQPKPLPTPDSASVLAALAKQSKLKNEEERPALQAGGVVPNGEDGMRCLDEAAGLIDSDRCLPHFAPLLSDCLRVLGSARPWGDSEPVAGSTSDKRRKQVASPRPELGGGSLRKVTPTQPVYSDSGEFSDTGERPQGLVIAQAALVQDLLSTHPELATLLNYVVSQVVKNALREAILAIETSAAAAIFPLKALILDGFGECSRTLKRRERLRGFMEDEAIVSVGMAVSKAVELRVPVALGALAPHGTPVALLSQLAQSAAALADKNLGDGRQAARAAAKTAFESAAKYAIDRRKKMAQAAINLGRTAMLGWREGGNHTDMGTPLAAARRRLRVANAVLREKVDFPLIKDMEEVGSLSASTAPSAQDPLRQLYMRATLAKLEECLREAAAAIKALLVLYDEGTGGTTCLESMDETLLLSVGRAVVELLRHRFC